MQSPFLVLYKCYFLLHLTSLSRAFIKLGLPTSTLCFQMTVNKNLS